MYEQSMNPPLLSRTALGVTQSHPPNRAKAVEAAGLLLQIKFLLMFDGILTCTKSLSEYLQQVNLVRGADLVSATVSTLQLFRTEEEWDKLSSYAEQVTEVKHIIIVPRQTQLPHVRAYLCVAICLSYISELSRLVYWQCLTLAISLFTL